MYVLDQTEPVANAPRHEQPPVSNKGRGFAFFLVIMVGVIGVAAMFYIKENPTLLTSILPTVSQVEASIEEESVVKVVQERPLDLPTFIDPLDLKVDDHVGMLPFYE